MRDDIAEAIIHKFVRSGLVFFHWYIKRIEREKDNNPKDIEELRTLVDKLKVAISEVE